MKKSLLALAVLGAFAAAAQAQSSVTIYGIVDTGVVYQSKQANSSGGNSSNVAVVAGVLSGSRFGFKGSEDLGGGLKANFRLEAGFNSDTGTSTQNSTLFGRWSTVGLSGNFGTVNIGRQLDFAGTHTSQYSSAGYMGVFTQSNGSTQAGLQNNRTNNSIRYDIPDFNGLSGGLMYGFGEQAGSYAAGRSYGLGLTYTNGPLSLGGSYYAANIGSTPSDTPSLATSTTLTSTALKTSTLGISYVMGQGKLYSSWSHILFPLASATGSTTFSSTSSYTANNKLDLYELGYNYDLTASMKLMAAYSYTRAQFISGAPTGAVNMLTVGTDYFLSKRTDLYALVEYMRSNSNVTNPLSITGSSSTGTTGSAYALGVGIRHAF